MDILRLVYQFIFLAFLTYCYHHQKEGFKNGNVIVTYFVNTSFFLKVKLNQGENTEKVSNLINLLLWTSNAGGCDSGWIRRCKLAMPGISSKFISVLATVITIA